jgi:hypothetical protein
LDALAARGAALRPSKARKDDTSPSIVVGAVILAKVEQGEFDERQLRRWLDKALPRADHRAFFGLSALYDARSCNAPYARSSR